MWTRKFNQTPAIVFRSFANCLSPIAYVVYEDIYDAKAACEHLSGFNVLGRYLIVVYYNAQKRFAQEAELSKRQEDIDAIRKKLDMNKEEKELKKLGEVNR